MILLQGESSAGDRLAESARRQLAMVEDEEIVNYVAEIGHKLAKVAGRDDLEYKFHVVNQEAVNAFALPGGKIFVNAGAILETNSEAELAGLLAHELSHAILSHGFQMVAQSNLTANVVLFIPYVGNTATNLIVLNYSREMETEADVLGTKILAASGYAADGVRNLMIKIDRQQEQKQAPPAWLSTHPETGNRVAYLEELIVSNKLNRYSYEGVERHWQIKQKVRQLLTESQQEEENKI
jgi:predicted Zn-dependent protease